MCTINMVFNKNKKKVKIMNGYMNAVSWSGWQLNNDGEGFFGFSDKVGIRKKKEKIRYSGNDFWLISSHQRKATTGYSNKNIQPVITQNLIIEHNGVLDGLGNHKTSDTVVFAKALNKLYEKNGHNIVKAIQKITKVISGTYSVVVFEIKTNKIFYFKEYRTDMYSLENENWFFMSTKKANLEYAQFLFGITNEIETVESEKIYNVLEGFEVVGKFVSKVETTYSCPKQDVKSVPISDLIEAEEAEEEETDKKIEEIEEESTVEEIKTTDELIKDAEEDIMATKEENDSVIETEEEYNKVVEVTDKVLQKIDGIEYKNMTCWD